MKKLIDNNIIGDKWILEWYDQNKRLDKESMLYSKKSERKFRELLIDFVDWVKTAETENAETSADETTQGKTVDDDDDEDDQIKEKGSKAPETDAQRKQREAIEKQRKQ
jgi:hypothetical protein